MRASVRFACSWTEFLILKTKQSSVKKKEEFPHENDGQENVNVQQPGDGWHYSWSKGIVSFCMLNQV